MLCLLQTRANLVVLPNNVDQELTGSVLLLYRVPKRSRSRFSISDEGGHNDSN